MNKNPFFSILIPVYNAVLTLPRLMRSIFEQNFSDYEIIICDDASTDNTLSILQEYGDRIKILKHAANQKALISRNDLIREAQGKYCIFADADDEFLPDFFSRAYNVLLKQHYDILQFSFSTICEGSAFREKQIEKMGFVVPCKKNGEKIFFHYLYCYRHVFAPYAKVYSRPLLMKALPENFIQPRINDVPLTARAAFFANTFCAIGGKSVYRYHYGAGGFGKKNISMNEFKKLCVSANRAIIDLQIFLKQNHAEQFIKRIEELLVPDITMYISSGIIEKKDWIEAMNIFCEIFDGGNIFNKGYYISYQTPINDFLRISFRFFLICCKRWKERITAMF